MANTTIISLSPQASHALSSLISIGLSRFMMLDTTTALTLSSLLHELLSDDLTTRMYSLLKWQYILFVAVMIVLYRKRENFDIYYQYFNTKSTTSIKVALFTTDLIDVVRFFMQHNPTFFNQYYNVEYGNPTYVIPHDDMDEYPPLLILPENSAIIPFNDVIHKVQGRIIARFIEIKREVNGKTTINRRPYLEMWIDHGSTTGMQYIELLKKWRVDKLEQDKHKIYYHVKIMSHSGKMHNHYTTLHSGLELSREVLYQKYMEPYFSPHKKQLWKHFSTIQWEPEKITALGQNPSLNLLLYGPPGTGKSTLAYRLAMSLKRHLISFDLTCADSRKSIYKVFQCPEVYNPKTRDHTLEPKDFILLLEEFDIVIDYLMEKKKRSAMPRISFGMMDLEEENEKEKEKSKLKKQTFEYVSHDREFALEDLLELFQGAVPLPGSIIIATTNHFDKIYSALPALFRPGRLTPIHFDNLDWDTLQEISRYYFGKELTLKKVDRVAYETSKIIELAVKSKLESDNQFEYFQDKLKTLLDSQRN